MADEFSKKAFMLIANTIGRNILLMDESWKNLNHGANTISFVVLALVERLEKVHGRTLELDKIKKQIKKTTEAQTNPELGLAVQSIIDSWSDISDSLGKLVGALPEDKPDSE